MNLLKWITLPFAVVRHRNIHIHRVWLTLCGRFDTKLRKGKGYNSDSPMYEVSSYWWKLGWLQIMYFTPHYVLPRRECVYVLKRQTPLLNKA